MIDVPPEVQIKALICPGRTYLFSAEDRMAGNKHFHVVLNTKPKEDELIVMVAAETITAGHVNNYWTKIIGEGAIVQAVVGEAEFIKHPTLFRCHSPKIMSRDEIVSKLCCGQLVQKGTVSDSLLEKLRQGVLISKTVDRWIKDLVNEG